MTDELRNAIIACHLPRWVGEDGECEHTDHDADALAEDPVDRVEREQRERDLDAFGASTSEAVQR